MYRWAERILDSGDKVAIPRNELEQLRADAKMPLPAKHPISSEFEAKLAVARRIREAEAIALRAKI